MNCDDKKAGLLKISRLLTPKGRADLLTWVHLAYAAENSVRKQLDMPPAVTGAFKLNQQEYSCGNISRRSKK